ncbi:SctD/MshK family protein [Acidovorax facilis]|uniref:SctD/MshK family protein n=1 Tax=Acidovorax facilis TaxID=12917 RepID=UPI003CEC5ED4
MNTETLYELRVLSGEQRGASSVIQPGQTLRIGQDWINEVVLQKAEGVAVLSFSSTGTLVLQVEQGGGAVAHRMLEAGSRAELDLYEPFTVGGIRLAVGQLGAQQWAPLFTDAAPEGSARSATPRAHEPAPASQGAADARPDAGMGPSASQASSAAAQSGADPAAVAAGRVSPWQRWRARLLLGGTALVGVSVCTLTLAWAMGPSTLSPQEHATNIRQTLSHLGMATLNVESRNGQLYVIGHLESQAEKTRLEKALADRSPARLSVWVNEQVAASVAEVYRLNGIAAQVEAAGAGVVRVHTTVAVSDVRQLEHVQALTRRDVPGLQQLVAVNEPPPAPPPAESAIRDPGKRVAAIVPGEPAYLVTVDGTRYFEGAMLPSGHRVVAILPDKVQMEREGVASVLSF